MLTHIHPKLPMRSKDATKNYYISLLGFIQFGSDEHSDYLMVAKDEIQLHFFLFTELNPKENYGMVYIRTNAIEALYQTLLDKGVAMHPNGSLGARPWGQKEFSLLDPDNNLLTFGQSLT